MRRGEEMFISSCTSSSAKPLKRYSRLRQLSADSDSGFGVLSTTAATTVLRVTRLLA